MKIREKMSRWKSWMPLLVASLALTGILSVMPAAFADTDIQLIMDGKRVSATPAPLISNNRMLVPLRIISEELGAVVTWNNADRSVTITKGSRTILLRIDRNLIDYTVDSFKHYQLSDVAPKIFSDRTFVPIRLISNALGVGIEWDETLRTVAIDSTQSSAITPFFAMNISSVQPRSTVTGTTTLQSTLSAPLPVGAAEIKYLLLNPDTGTGYVIARGTALDVAYEWLPAMRDNGTKVLVAAVYNSSGKFLSGDAIPIQVALQPVVSLTGIEQNQTVNTSVRLGANLNFSAAYVKYQITNTTNSKTVTTAEQDPIGGYQWTPSMEYNGDVTVTVTAYDQKKQPYASQAVQVKVEMPRKLSLSGVKAGQTVDKPVTLAASRNFDVIETEYYSRDVQTGSLLLLARVQYVSYSWFPGPGMAGNKELFVRVKATDGTVYNSAPIQVNVIGAPKLLLQGAGPNQMITTAAPAKLKVESNVLLSSVKYLMTNTVTGTQKVIADLKDASQVYTYTPAQGDNGSWKIKAVGTYGTGQTASTEEVTVKVYTGKIYTAQPIIEKSKFLNMASSLAVVDFNKSGMSAALQTAQAILETGWGQSVPVDKYSGQFSSNLFGIKGTGTAGSVISNTWEEYNGVAFRVDAKFRAYYSVNESWWDHNKLLMTGTRYEPFRNVMFDSSLGAWALRRAGYATDSKYPVKLMDIIETYQLEQLDQVGI